MIKGIFYATLILIIISKLLSLIVPPFSPSIPNEIIEKLFKISFEE